MIVSSPRIRSGGSPVIRHIIVIAIGIVASAIAVSALPEGGDKGDVLAAQSHFSETRSTCNAAEMERLVTDDMMWFHSNGRMELNKAEFVAYLRDNSQNPLLCGLDEFRVDVKIVRIYGDTAVLSGDFYFKAKGRPAMFPPEKSLQIFVKRNGRWLLAANQTTKITTPPPSSGDASRQSGR